MNSYPGIGGNAMTCACTETALCEDCRMNIERDVYEPRNYDELERRHRELRSGCSEAVNQALEIAEMLTILPDERTLFDQHIRALRQIRAALDRDRDGTR